MGQVIYYALLAFFVLAILLTMWNDRRQEKEEERTRQKRMAMEKENMTISNPDLRHLGTRDIFLETLTKIGCQYKLGEGDDTRIFFDYQGEHFFADTTNDIVYVHLWDTHWGHIELYDIDEVSRLRKAINTSNLNTAVTTVFTIDEAGSNMDVHSKRTFLFISQIPQLDMYLKTELNSFFRAHQLVGCEMQKLREKE